METKNMSIFTGKIIQVGGSKGLGIPPNILTYEGLKPGDHVRVYIKKLPKKKEE